MPSLTLTFSAQHADDLAWAFGKKLGIAQDATAAQVKADVTAYMKSVWRDQKRIADSAVNPPAELDII